MFHELLQIKKEVLSAMESQMPIVVLESAIISHGMPFPENLSTALAVEQIIRAQGAIPATVAIFQGQIHIGIDESVMHHLASKEVMKASRRDISYTLCKKIAASTTVAATIFCAYLAGLSVCVTGGIGGVHHQTGDNYDVSADLLALSLTPVTVICSGVKSILDLPKTLDVLEAYGVPVIGYRTNEFPAFYSHSSNISLQQRLDSADQIAQLMHTQRYLTMKNGIVIANPIPIHAEITDEQLAPIIEQAHREAKQVNGKSITPFLLNRIAELTNGQSLQANIELIKSNAKLGAEIAISYQNQFFEKK